MTSERLHLSIGEVLTLLQPEFPDITISKIRFLESQGLLDPERTPSGYRKFLDDDIEQLRWILTQQRDHFLPLKVIKERLASGDLGPGTPEGVLPLNAEPTDPEPADSATEPAEPADSAADSTEQADSAVQPAEAALAGAGAGAVSAPASVAAFVTASGARAPVSPPRVGDQPSGTAAPAPPTGESREKGVTAGSASGRAPTSAQAQSSPGDDDASEPGSADDVSTDDPASSDTSPGPAKARAAGSDGTDGTVEIDLTEPVPTEPVRTELVPTEVAASVASGSTGPSTEPDRTEPPESGDADKPDPPDSTGHTADDSMPSTSADERTPSTSANDDEPSADAAATADAAAGPAPEGSGARRRHPTVHQQGEPTATPATEADEGSGTRSSTSAGGANGAEPAPGTLTLEELTAGSGLSAREIAELERYGLIEAAPDDRESGYDNEALVVARLAAGFNRYGIEPRHLRMYKVAADREAGLFEQLITPLLKQRRPSARQQAVEMLEDLAELADDLRAAMVRAALRDYLGGS